MSGATRFSSPEGHVDRSHAFSMGNAQFLECITENCKLIPDHPTKLNAPVGASMRAWRQLRSSGEITPENLTDCPLRVQPNCYNDQDVELHRLTKLREQYPGSPIVEICDMWSVNWSEPVKRHARELDIARIGAPTEVTMNVQVLLQVNTINICSMLFFG